LPVRSVDNPIRSIDSLIANIEAEGTAVKPAYSSREVLSVLRVSNDTVDKAPKFSSRLTASLNRRLQTNSLNLAAIFKHIKSDRIL
jgi:hypothetical protein